MTARKPLGWASLCEEILERDPTFSRQEISPSAPATAGNGPQPAQIGMRSSDLPPEPSRQRLRTARAFLDALWELRDRLDPEGGLLRADVLHLVGRGVQFGQTLDYAALYPGRMRARPGEIPCRDDGWRWNVARRSFVRDNTFEQTLWAIWGSLEPLERQILALERTLTHQEVAEKLRREGVLTVQGREPTGRFVRIRRQAHEKIAGHQLFKELGPPNPASCQLSPSRAPSITVYVS